MVTGDTDGVDLELNSSSGEFLYRETRRQCDEMEFTAEEHGIYQFCFSNQFSKFAHKVIYFSLYRNTKRELVSPSCLSCISIDQKVEEGSEHEIHVSSTGVDQNRLTMVYV